MFDFSWFGFSRLADCRVAKSSIGPLGVADDLIGEEEWEAVFRLFTPTLMHEARQLVRL